MTTLLIRFSWLKFGNQLCRCLLILGLILMMMVKRMSVSWQWAFRKWRNWWSPGCLGTPVYICMYINSYLQWFQFWLCSRWFLCTELESSCSKLFSVGLFHGHVTTICLPSLALKRKKKAFIALYNQVRRPSTMKIFHYFSLYCVFCQRKKKDLK